MEPKKILIIEDEHPLSRVLDLKLSNAGFKTEVVFNGAEAISLIDKKKFDLILLDLILPIQDGFAVLKKINDNEIKTPVVVLSNLSQTDDIKKCKELNPHSHYFVKSNISIKNLVENVKKILSV